MLFNWILSMAMLMTTMAISEKDKMAILAIIATIVMANVYFSVAIRAIKLKSIKY